jgi:tetratricopeptide (TPR) repeat protein
LSILIFIFNFAIHKKKTMRNVVLISLLLLLGACGPNPEKSDKLMEEGLMLVYYAKYDEAIEKYDEAIRYNPDNFEAYYNRGNAKASLRRYEEAIEDYTKAIEINPRYADAFANRGQMKFYLNDRDGACKDWQEAFDLGKPNMDDKLQGCPKE